MIISKQKLVLALSLVLLSAVSAQAITGEENQEITTLEQQLPATEVTANLLSCEQAEQEQTTAQLEPGKIAPTLRMSKTKKALLISGGVLAAVPAWIFIIDAIEHDEAVTAKVKRYAAHYWDKAVAKVAFEAIPAMADKYCDILEWYDNRFQN